MTVSILFITPTTVYVVAETSDWHQKPAHEMPIPKAHEMNSHHSAVFVTCTEASRSSRSSPAMRQMKSAGRMEKVLV